jgi:hypothetical protein
MWRFFLKRLTALRSGFGGRKRPLRLFVIASTTYIIDRERMELPTGSIQEYPEAETTLNHPPS